MNIYGASVSIPVTTPAQELAAWLFLKFFSKPVIQAKWIDAGNGLPTRIGAVEALDDNFSAHPAYQHVFDMLKYGHFEPSVPGYDSIRDLVSETMAEICEGAPVDDTLQILNSEANEILLGQMSALLPTPVIEEDN